MKAGIRFGSVCSGIEAASVAFEPLGWRAAWFSEIEAFPSAVLAHHYPRVPNHGDMRGLACDILAGKVEAPDALVGGTPCQAFSVAGSRKSLADERGNLSLVFCRIADAIDHVRAGNGKPPTVILWENVPGVLSTKDNAFGCFLGELAGESCQLEPPGGRWSNAGLVHGPARTIAWRVFDAQYFGLAQRRRRVFVVASARDDFDPAAVLFEFDRLRRDFAPRREAREGTAGAVETGAAFGGGATSGPRDVAACLVAKGQKLDFEVETFVTHALRGEGFDASEDGTGRGTPIVPVAFTTQDYGNDACTDFSPTLRSGGAYGANGAVMPAVTVALRGREGGATAELGDDLSGCLRASGGGGDKPHVLARAAVRRLTPRECERLQGFPDDYTRIPWRGKPADQCPDGPRYKALGNSWAVPNVRWIGARITLAINIAMAAQWGGWAEQERIAANG